MQVNQTSAIILAAGFSSRMGTLKALLPWRGKTLIEYQMEQMKRANIKQIIVVLGNEAERIQKVISPYDVTQVFNEEFTKGKSTSIRKGVSTIDDSSEQLIISAVDQPVPSKTLTTLLNAIQFPKYKILIPIHHEKRGHPILFHRSMIPNLLKVNEETKGLREVIRKYSSEIQYVPVHDPHVLLNLNRPEDYEKYKGGLS